MNINVALTPASDSKQRAASNGNKVVISTDKFNSTTLVLNPHNHMSTSAKIIDGSSPLISSPSLSLSSSSPSSSKPIIINRQLAMTSSSSSGVSSSMSTTAADTNNNNIDFDKSLVLLLSDHDHDGKKKAPPMTATSPAAKSYMNAYAKAFDLDDTQRDNVFFVQDEPVHVAIVDHEAEPSMHGMLNTKVYIIRVRHAGVEWLVKRKYKSFLRLYEAYALFKTKMNLKHAVDSSSNETSTTASLEEKEEHSKFHSSDHFKFIFRTTIASDFEHAKRILTKFLKDVVEHKMFRNHNETLKFLEVSHLSFISELGDKNKEGIIKKRTGSHKVNIGCFFSSVLTCGWSSFFWDTRWLIVKDTWVGYLHPKTGAIRGVLLVDHAFRVCSGEAQTGDRCGLLIQNLSRNLFIKCVSEKRADEWREVIEHMTCESAAKYQQSERFESFAPVQSHSTVRWFVDGSDYMECIADSLEQAREEIFITGFFLSPEIYLKRPVVEGDRWRLDKLLQRKAEEGVKIYVLIYKEIEITLPINSAYSKRVLALSHKNIKVLRHPDQLTDPNQYLHIMWAHHEKLVVIDQSVAFFGGIDLCYGRWDNFHHKLVDLGSVLSAKPAVVIAEQHKVVISSCEKSSSPRVELSKVALVEEINEPEVIAAIVTKEEEEVVAAAQPADEADEEQQRTTGGLRSKIKLRAMRMLSVPARTTMLNTEEDVEAEDYMRQLFQLQEQYNKKHASRHRHPVMRKASDVTGYGLQQHIYDDDEQGEHHDENGQLLAAAFLFDEYKFTDPCVPASNQPNRSSVAAAAASTRQRTRLRRRLKRSKSLDSGDNGHRVKLMTASNKDEGTNSRFRMFKDSLNQKFFNKSGGINANNGNVIAVNDSSLEQRECKEISIFTKFKKVKQFKESLKRFNRADAAAPTSPAGVAISAVPNPPSATDKRKNSGGSITDFNSSFDTQDIDKSFELSSSEQMLTINNLQGSSKYWVGKDYCNFIVKDVKNVHSPFQDSINRTQIPRMPWHDVAGCVGGPAARDIARHFIQRWNYIKCKKVRNNDAYPLLVPKSYEQPQLQAVPRVLLGAAPASVQVLRCVSSWSAGLARTESSIHAAMKHLILTAEHYVYIENQFFISKVADSKQTARRTIHNEIATCIYERIVRAHSENKPFKVYVCMPLVPGYQGEYGRSSGVLLHAITHYNNTSIESIISKLRDEAKIDPHEYICFFGLRTWSELSGLLVTELIYVHSKLLIVDDRACIIGSANINDRSLRGDRDSEVALLVEDTQLVSGILNKKPCTVGRFASSLRQRLFREFLGEFPTASTSSCGMASSSSCCLSSLSSTSTQRKFPASASVVDENGEQQPPIDVSDPCSEEFYKQVLLKYASQNTRIYENVFKVIPSDTVFTFAQLRKYACDNKLATTSIDIARNELKKVKGYIVLYPYKFLKDEDLLPSLGSKEVFLPATLWT